MRTTETVTEQVKRYSVKWGDKGKKLFSAPGWKGDRDSENGSQEEKRLSILKDWLEFDK